MCAARSQSACAVRRVAVAIAVPEQEAQHSRSNQTARGGLWLCCGCDIVWQYLLSWEAATERLLDAAQIPETASATRADPLASLAFTVHNLMGVPGLDDYFRQNSGATPGSALCTAWRHERGGVVEADTKARF